MKLFLRIFLMTLSCWLFFQRKSSIEEVRLGWKKTFWLLANGMKYWHLRTLIPSLQIKLKNYIAGKYVTLFLKKQKGMVGHSIGRVFMQKQPSKGFFEKGVMLNFTKFTRKHLCRDLFLIKLNSADLQLH